jgi:MFS family permease
VLQKIPLDKLVNFMVILFSASLCLVAAVPIFLVDGAGIFLCGACWLGLLSNFNATIQSIVPAWVRGRCLAVYMLIFFGGMAMGSFLWGAVANIVGIPAAMYLAAGGLLVGLLATLRLRMVSGELDHTPAMRSQPAVVFEPQPEQGPVMVTVDYRIDPNDWREFGQALRKLKRARLRGGAFRWGVYVDLSNPSIYRETFLVESWLEHLRQHERQTIADREIQRSVRSFHKGEGSPVVTHLVAVPLPEKKPEG